jgi:adenylosuccinate synthase
LFEGAQGVLLTWILAHLFVTRGVYAQGYLGRFFYFELDGVRGLKAYTTRVGAGTFRRRVIRGCELLREEERNSVQQLVVRDG